MNRLRGLIAGTLKARPIISKILAPAKVPNVRQHHFEGPPQPFDNLPFSIPNRYVATVVFSVFFGVGLWAPFLLVWYMMAKKTM